MENKDELDKFVDQLIDEKNISGLTPEGREQVAKELKAMIGEQINRAILMELTDEQLDVVDKMMDEEGMTDERIREYIINSGVNVNKVAVETLLYFRAFYLGNGNEQ